MLHPESTAYDLFDGKKYPAAPLPTVLSKQAQATMKTVDRRLNPLDHVLGVEVEKHTRAFPLEKAGERACYTDMAGEEPIVVLWYGPTRTAVAYSPKVDGRVLTFYADEVSPETAPFKDRETGTRWTLAGRAVDGPLRGKDLNWIPSIQCRWYAWVTEYPETRLYSPAAGTQARSN